MDCTSLEMLYVAYADGPGPAVTNTWWKDCNDIISIFFRLCNSAVFKACHHAHESFSIRRVVVWTVKCKFHLGLRYCVRMLP
jgi:hypothetical protein